MAGNLPPPPECAQCGASIPPRARACPECGADERTGWRESSVYDGLDLPSAFSDGDNDSADENKKILPVRRVNGIAWYWWCIAVAVLLLLGLFFLGLL